MIDQNCNAQQGAEDERGLHGERGDADDQAGKQSHDPQGDQTDTVTERLAADEVHEHDRGSRQQHMQRCREMGLIVGQGSVQAEPIDHCQHDGIADRVVGGWLSGDVRQVAVTQRRFRCRRTNTSTGHR